MRLSGKFFIIVIAVLSAASIHATGDTPKLKLKVSNTSIELGGKVQVNWRSKNASNFIVVTGPEHKKRYTGKKRPRKTRRGQIILQPVRSGEFTFTVSNKHGKTEKTIFIEVNSDTVAPETPLITSFLVSGVSASVSWDTTTDNKSTHENIDYLLYRSNDPNESDFSDLPHEVYKGEERGRIEGLSERSRYYIYLVARDEAGNTSAPAGPLEINTMEQNIGVDILPDLVIRDLIKLNLTYSKTDLDIKVRKTGLNIEFMPGDIVVEYHARRISYSRVLFVSDLGDEVLLDIEPAEPLELLTEGEVNVGGLQYIESQSSESRADMPLSVITVPFKDDFSSSFKGKVEGVNVEGKLSGRANINMKIFEGGFPQTFISQWTLVRS
ncbi:hypothetical protein [uncultured Pseudoteredinibacter sp.]|uniref:hypothetical protein n=1 Tax=uncultured Pseudoteredinibacter sp. TaxID=1641701 RepID=UPI002621754A|nr:hypothetical protein [uncultured Pseudoteredinibacter sp.]